MLTIEGPQTVALAQAEITRGQDLVNGAANAKAVTFTPVYELADTLANLEKAPVLVEGATSYALTNEPGNLGVLTPEQIKIVEGASDAAEYTWEIAPQKAEFTTQIDTIDVSAQAGEVIVKNGIQTGVQADETYQTGDSVIGNGEKTIVELLATNGAAGASVVSLTDVGRVDISVAPDAGGLSAVNAVKWTRVGEAWLTNDGGAGDGVAIANGSLETTYGIRDSAVATTYNIGIRASEITGTADTVKVVAENVGRQSATNPADITRVTFNSTSAGVENIEVATKGDNFVAVDALGAGVTLKGVNVTGDGTNHIRIEDGALRAGWTVDASESTGANTINVADNLQNDVTVLGGSGADILTAREDGVVTGVSVTDVETFRVEPASVGNITFATGTKFDTIQIMESAATAVTLARVGAPSIEFVGDGVDTTAARGNDATFGGVTINNSYGGSNVAVEYNNQGVVKSANVDYIGGDITARGVESIDITVNDIAASGTFFTGNYANSLAGGLPVAGVLDSLSVTTEGSVQLTADFTAGLTLLDFGAVEGTLTTATGAAAIALQLGAGGVIVGAKSGSTFTFEDQGAGNFTFNGSDAIDIISAAVVGTANASTVELNGFGGNDQLTGGLDGDVINGGAGDDIITGNAGVDQLAGGLGADDFIMTNVVDGAKAIGVDNVEDFSVAQGDQIGNYSAANLETSGKVTNLVYASDLATEVKAGNLAATVTEISAAYDLSTAGTGSILSVDSATAFTAATLADALENKGALELTFNNSGAGAVKGDGFLIIWDNNVDTFISVVTSAAGVADGKTAAAGDLTVTDLTTLVGVTDASTVTTANLLPYLA